MKQKFRVIALLLSLVILAALFIGLIHAQDTYKIDSTPWDGESVAASFAAGDGSAERPYVIASAAQLAYFRQLVNSGNAVPGDYYILGADINLNGEDWDPIGPTASGYATPCFSGTFDGRGYTIRNLTINTGAGVSRVGFFGGIQPVSVPNPDYDPDYVPDPEDPDYDPEDPRGISEITYKATIQNIVFDRASITTNQSGSFFGVVAGEVSGVTISGITVTSSCSVSGKYARAGGIAGNVIGNSVIEYCVNYANITIDPGSTSMFAGGIAGATGGGSTIRYCANNGNVYLRGSGSAVGAGGISGIIGVGTGVSAVENCYNTGEIDSFVRAGGIIGYINSDLGHGITSSYNLSSNIIGSSATVQGQIIGYVAYAAQVTECVGIADIELGQYGSIGPNASSQTTEGFGSGTEAEIRALCDVIDTAIANGIAALNAIEYYPDGLEIETNEVTLPPLVTPPADTTPAVTTPEVTTPEVTTPEVTTPVETTPVETTPVETTPEETTPVQTTPEETTPEETTPVETTPDETTPDATTPDATTPGKTDDKKGCGSSLSITFLPLALTVGAALTFRRKRK